MSLKSLRKIPKTIGFRLTFWYSGLFVFSVFLLFLFAYFYLQTTLVRRDHEEIATKLHELETLYQSGGLELIERNIRSSQKIPKKNKFLIRIADWHNHTVFLYLPYQWIEFNLRKLAKIPPTPHKLIHLSGSSSDVVLEVGSLALPTGFWLQVGQDTRERQQILRKFKDVATIIIFPLLLLGILGGNLLAYRALRPIRHLIESVRSITHDTSALEQRVANPKTGDELEELILLFNEMLQKIETLIKGMKDSLDNVAHDLRTPITRLRGTAELALQKETLPEECQNALAECLEESLEIQKLLNILLDISEAETGVLRLHLEPISVSQLLQKVLDLYKIVAEEKGISLEMRCPPALYVTGDPVRLSQALANLVDNAIKFTPSGGKVTMEAKVEQDKAAISVKDTGPGIQEKDLPRIWERLYRGDESRSQKGMGLGLSLVKAIITRHGGDIVVNSVSGRGTVFTIFLPLTEFSKANRSNTRRAS